MRAYQLLGAAGLFLFGCLAQAQSDIRLYKAQGRFDQAATTANSRQLGVVAHGARGQYSEYYQVLSWSAGSTQAWEQASQAFANVASTWSLASMGFGYDLRSAWREEGEGIRWYDGLPMTWQAGAAQARGDLSSIRMADRLRSYRFTQQAWNHRDNLLPTSIALNQSAVITSVLDASVALDLRELILSTNAPPDSVLALGPNPLPVVLRSPTEFHPVATSLVLSTTRATPLPPGPAALPDPLSLDKFTSIRSFSVSYMGIYGIEVRRQDYADDTSFEQAQSWVASYIGNVSMYYPIEYRLESLTPVPEPATALLALLGLGALTLRGRAVKPRN